MAEIIPSLNRLTLGRMTAGERRVARRLEALLEDDYLVWYDIPIGRKRRYPDFIILHPSRGLLFLEVKDWKPETLKQISKTEVHLLTDRGLVTESHPLEQARQYAYAVINTLQRDPQLCQQSGHHQGKLRMPYGWGVVLTNITRRQIEQAIPEEMREQLLPDHLLLYRDDITETADAERFQEQLWGMFHYQFGGKLTLPQIDRIRWHLFPEIRIDGPTQDDLFAPNAADAPPAEQALPDIIKIMDIQQEQLARSLGEGHRVIHGVAGSGKTMILGYRCLALAETTSKPILVLCFNSTLAAKLRAFIAEKGITGQVQVYHFHDWCGKQLKTYHVSVPAGDKPYWEREVEAVIAAVERGDIPRAQYGAVLIDEGHDFEAEWLQLVVQMIDPETNALLFLYDDAQSIYKKKRGLGFSLASVGIQAQGRTTVLRLNYRNTREILQFAYAFAQAYLDSPEAGADDLPLIEPEAAGTTGPKPEVRQLASFDEEIRFAQRCLQSWHQQGVAWNDMAILYPANWQGRLLHEAFKQTAIPYAWLGSRETKLSYNPSEDRVALMTLHSSKGLEFKRVIIVGVGQMKDDDEERATNARVLYVGMTRSQECLLVTHSASNAFSKQLMRLAS